MNDLKRYSEKRVTPTYEAVPTATIAAKRRPDEEEADEVIVEERITDRYGNVSVKKYLRGRFLGKVSESAFLLSHHP